MPDLYFLVITFLTAVILILLFLLTKKSKNPFSDLNNKEGLEIIKQAMKKAQETMSASELESLKLVSDTKFYKEKFEKEFSTQVETTISSYGAQIQQLIEESKEHLQEAEKSYLNYLSYLRTESDRSRNESIETVQNQIADLFTKFEGNLNEFLTDTENNSVAAVENEVKVSRQMIENYKTTQLKLVDENIISMLETTLALVINKKLTLKDQMDLVYEALEKAKAEKFIG